MLSLGFWEIVVIAVLAVVVVGPERLPRVMRYIGRQYGQLRRMADEMRRALVLEADRQDASSRYDEMKRRREELRAQRDEAESGGAVSQVPDLPLPLEDTEEFQPMVDIDTLEASSLDELDDPTEATENLLDSEPVESSPQEARGSS